MRPALHRRRHVFRSLLILALLAWAAFAVEAIAHPLGMLGESIAQQASLTTGAAACADVHVGAMAADAAHPAAPAHPDHGHGCCQHGCWCASLCSGIVGVPYLDLELPPVRAAAFALVHPQPARALSAPPLRPPIA